MRLSTTTCLLSQADSLVGANTCTSTTLGASFGINRILVAFRNCSRGTFVNTSTASNAVVTNYVSHNTKYLFVNNIYHTGDIAWRDKDGYFWFVGRADDIIKSSGYRISPFEVESVLMTHKAIVECAVTAAPDELRGQVIKATVVLADEYKNCNHEEMIKDIQEYVKKTTAPYKYPRIVEIVDKLPKTISGKIRRVEIREKDN